MSSMAIVTHAHAALRTILASGNKKSVVYITSSGGETDGHSGRDGACMIVCLCVPACPPYRQVCGWVIETTVCT